MCTFIVPDKILESLICANCDCYLSVLPIRNINDETRCGRCCNEKQGFYSPLEKHYKNGLFRCSNRYQGCNKLMKFGQTLKHEKQCEYSIEFIRCEKCPTLNIRTTGIINHFKIHHSSNILSKPKFTLDISNALKDVYLYSLDDIIFLINVEYDKTQRKLFSGTTYVNQLKLKNISQQLLIKYVNHKKSKILTEVLPCNKLNELQYKCLININNIPYYNPTQLICKVNIVCGNQTIKPLELVADQQTAQTLENTNPVMLESKEVQTESNDEEIEQINGFSMLHKNTETIPLQFISALGVHLTEKFLEEYPEYSLTACGTALFKGVDDRIDLCCSNCKQFTGTFVFSCKNSHVRCWDCKVWCDICDDVADELNPELSSLNGLLMLPCRWKCKKLFFGTELKSHEENCTHRPNLKCPVCKVLVAYSEVEVHFQIHDNCLLYMQFPPIDQIGSNVNVYFLIRDNFFVVTGNVAPHSFVLKRFGEIKNCTMMLIVNDSQVNVLKNRTYRLSGINKCRMLLKSKNISQIF